MWSCDTVGTFTKPLGIIECHRSQTAQLTIGFGGSLLFLRKKRGKQAGKIPFPYSQICTSSQAELFRCNQILKKGRLSSQNHNWKFYLLHNSLDSWLTFSWGHETAPWFRCNVFLVWQHLVDLCFWCKMQLALASKYDSAGCRAISWARNPTQRDDSNISKARNRLHHRRCSWYHDASSGFFIHCIIQAQDSGLFWHWMNIIKI